MATPEITKPDRRFITTSSFFELLADLTERETDRERIFSVPPTPVVRPINVSARGKTVQFNYLDNGEPRPTWFLPVLQGFASLITLPDNWDREGASRIDRATINRALTAIEQLLAPNAPAPAIVPISNSGLQIEWHRNQRDLEIEFSPSGEVEFYYFDEVNEEEREGPVGSDFAILKEYLERIW